MVVLWLKVPMSNAAVVGSTPSLGAKIPQSVCGTAKKKKDRTSLFYLLTNEYILISHYTQLSSVTQSCVTLCDPMNHSTPGLPVHQQHPESTQTHVH